MLRISTGGVGGEVESKSEVEGEGVGESERAVSMESALRTSILVEGSWGQVEGRSGSRLYGWKRRPVGGACGASARREGRRSLVSVAMTERAPLVLVRWRLEGRRSLERNRRDAGISQGGRCWSGGEGGAP